MYVMGFISRARSYDNLFRVRFFVICEFLWVNVIVCSLVSKWGWYICVLHPPSCGLLLFEFDAIIVKVTVPLGLIDTDAHISMDYPLHASPN